MAVKKNYLQKNEDVLFKLLMLIVVFVFASLIIPGIGAAVDAPTYWVNTVEFFTTVRDHIHGYWMFYTIGGAVLFTYLKKK